jgi:D-alanyl-D-alanine carboxypeptidase/D-alanyl-D-alanine-endopeptidase (penicillin-binding protein 4)
MKKLFLIGLFSFSAFAQDPGALVLDFKSMLQKKGLSPISEQSFCYQDGATVQGYQVEKLQRIASITKLFSTFFASETLDLNQRFETKIYISGDRLHIAGSRDPYFEEEKLLLLMNALNDLGYKSFKSVTFDSNFKFYDMALSSHLDIKPELTRQRLMTYFNSANSKFIRAKWLAAYEFGKEENVSLDREITPSLTSSKISLSNVNPLQDLSPTVYIHRSRPFHAILKSMNVMSKNIVAQNVFLEASRIKKFEALMTENGIERKSYQIYNGSGLPIKTSNSRFDNLASCRMVIKVIDLLGKSILKHQLALSDIVAVNGGKDLGSFRERFKDYPDTHEAVLSKTGTLMSASTLAGVLLIGQETPFAILNQTSNVATAKKFQDSFVQRFFHHLGEPTPMVYNKISIFPWDGNDFLELGN